MAPDFFPRRDPLLGRPVIQAAAWSPYRSRALRWIQACRFLALLDPRALALPRSFPYIQVKLLSLPPQIALPG